METNPRVTIIATPTVRGKPRSRGQRGYRASLLSGGFSYWSHFNPPERQPVT